MIEELVKKSRSFRGYDESVKISGETLEKLISAARFAPSSMNLQPLKFLTSNTDGDNAKIFEHTVWAGRLKDRRLPYEGRRPRAYIVICIDLSIAPNPTPFLKDVGIAAQTMLLCAAEMGYGGIMIGSFDKSKVVDDFALPGCLQPELVVALGKPAEKIILEDAAGGDVAYYRDENDVHHVPKRPLEELWINKNG